MRILVHGAGAIGQYLGAKLALGGATVHLVGRPALVEAVATKGMRVSDFDLPEQVVAGISASKQIPDGTPFDLVLLTVKGTGTHAAALELGAALAAGTPVVSFQNGVENVERIRSAAPSLTVLAGMVPYNVVQLTPGQVRRTTEGVLMAADAPVTRALVAIAAQAGLALELRTDMREVQWGKLLLNLNNPINALSGLPLRTQLLDRGYRRLLAALQAEGLAALRAAHIQPARVAPLPPSWIPFLLRLPTPVFRLIAARMLKIAPDARSSMYDDRLSGRPTEIDDLAGAVVRLAENTGIDAPLNRKLRTLVTNAPQGRWYSAEELWRTLL